MSTDASTVTFGLESRVTFNNDGEHVNIPQRTRFIGDEDALDIWWFISDELIDFSTGFTFTAKLAGVASPATIVFTKTTGFTGAVGTGTEANGTPNLSVDWATTAELNDVASGSYILEIVALKNDGSESTLQMQLDMRTRLG